MTLISDIDWGGILTGATITAIIGALAGAYVKIRGSRDRSDKTAHEINVDDRKTSLAQAFELIKALQEERKGDRRIIDQLRKECAASIHKEARCLQRLARAEQWIKSADDAMTRADIPHTKWEDVSGSHIHQVPLELHRLSEQEEDGDEISDSDLA